MQQVLAGGKKRRLENQAKWEYVALNPLGPQQLHALEGNYNKWDLAFDAGRQALTGSRKVLIGSHLGIIVPWACSRGLGWVFFVPNAQPRYTVQRG